MGPADETTSPPVRELIAHLGKLGFEIGVHPGYDSVSDPDRLAAETVRVSRAVGRRVRKVRQHYLRFRVPDTWHHQAAAGLEEDSTLGYPGHEGFRCGTCHAFRPFDWRTGREIDIVEQPLVVMDATLRLYRGLTPERGAERIRTLAERCREVDGTFTLLWHNSSLHGEWREWREAYERVVRDLARAAGTETAPDG